jgi:pyruvate/2-oxoglutarate dehydrogenase complex dihydrolipoamide acyltransferase (E2) component
MPGRFKRMKPTSVMAMAAQMWPKPNNPIIYGAAELEMTQALEYMKRYSEKHGVHVTATHLVIAMVARYLKKYPEVNVKCEAGKFYQRQDIDIFVVVSVPGSKEDLAGVMLRDCDKMSLADIAARVAGKAGEVKRGKDETYGKGRSIFERYPRWLMKIILKFGDFYINRMNRELPSLGMPKDPFGSATVSSLGMFGVEEGYGALMPGSRQPLFVLVTEVRDKPWVEDGKVVVRPIMNVMVTMDHRIMDGYKGGQFCVEGRRIIDNPEKVFGFTEKVPVGQGAEDEKRVEPRPVPNST